MAKRDEPRSGEGRLERWSRLKRETAAEKTGKAEPRQAPLEAETAALAPAAPATPPAAGKTEEQKKIEDVTKDLPPLESLGPDSDYTLFMRDGVPEEQRVAALRKLWRSDPAFTEKFPFEMHMEDYNETFTPINAATDTIYRAGIGYLFDDDKPEADKTAGKELVDQSAPRGIEVGDEKKSDSAESLPPTKEEEGRSNLSQVSIQEIQEEAPEEEKSPPGNSRLG